MEQVVLVDENDNQIGIEEKMAAHSNGGKLHRAISVFIFNSKGEMLLQQRALSKYHCPGLWTNTCCTHPRPGETIEASAHRRLREEMGFDCPMKEEFSFCYAADFNNGLTEKEYDHVLIGVYDGKVVPNPEEAENYKHVNAKTLLTDVAKNPESYTAWFKIIAEDVIKTFNGNKK